MRDFENKTRYKNIKKIIKVLEDIGNIEFNGMKINIEDLLNEVSVKILYVGRNAKKVYSWKGKYFSDNNTVKVRLNRNRAVYERDMEDFIINVDEAVVRCLGHELYHHIENKIKDDSEDRSHIMCDKFGRKLSDKYIVMGKEVYRNNIFL